MTSESATELVEAAAAAIAIARLLSLQLAGTFPALLSFLSVVAVSAVAGIFLSTSSPAFFWLYTVQTPIYCVLAMLSARELFAVVFRRYPGIRTAGRTAVLWGASFAFVIAVLFAIAHRGPGRSFSHLVYIELARRSTVLSVALFILFILYGLSRYPLHLGRNILISSAIFSVLFLSQAAQLLIDSFSADLYSHAVDLAAVAFGAACTLVWAFLLRPEPVRAPVMVKYSSDQEQQLLQQLDSLNRLLTRAARQ
jgi:hypothetical protein